MRAFVQLHRQELELLLALVNGARVGETEILNMVSPEVSPDMHASATRQLRALNAVKDSLQTALNSIDSRAGI